MKARASFPIPRATAKSPHAASISAALLLLTNLQRCVAWLIHHGVFIIGFRGWRGNGVDRVAITVAPSPALHRLFEGHCAWRQRRQDGALTIYTWVAERFGVRIEWEEVTCG